jgi:hypothetical protein
VQGALSNVDQCNTSQLVPVAIYVPQVAPSSFSMSNSSHLIVQLRATKIFEAQKKWQMLQAIARPRNYLTDAVGEIFGVLIFVIFPFLGGYGVRPQQGMRQPPHGHPGGAVGGAYPSHGYGGPPAQSECNILESRR